MAVPLTLPLTRPRSQADAALHTTARLWFVVATCGQWLFALYVAAYYGGSALRGNLDAWNVVFPRAHVAAAPISNAVTAMHLLFAVVIAVGGPLQLIPQLRARLPVVHRWTGRTYLIAVVAASLAGLYLVWIRGGAAGDTTQHVGLSLGAVLVIGFASMALRTARARDFAAHRRWALRLFLAASGVWFFRVGLMLWLVVNRAPVGFDPKTFSGPFLSVLSFVDYLFPLLVLELYFRARASTDNRTKGLMAAGLLALTGAMGVGIGAAALMMWL